MGKMTDNLCEHRWEQLCIKQGWDEMSQAVLFTQFVQMTGMMQDFYLFAQEQAERENSIVRKPDRRIG